MDEDKVIKIGDKEYIKLFDYTCGECHKPISKNEWWDWGLCEECMIKNIK